MSTQKQKISHKKHMVRTALILALIASAIVLITGGLSNAQHRVTEENFISDIKGTDHASETALMGTPSISVKSASESHSLVTVPTFPLESPSFDELAIPDNDPRTIKSGTMSLTVKDVHVTISDITMAARDFGGGILQKNIHENSEDNRSASLTIKIPVEDFDRTMAHIRSLAEEVSYENVTARDVTEEFVDQGSTLIQKKAQEQQILDEILPRAITVKDLILVENHLSGIRTDIERIEGRLAYLRAQTDFSTVSLTLTEEISTITDRNWRPGAIAINSFNTLISRIQGIIDHGIYLAISGLPIFILSLVALSICYIIGKRLITLVLTRISEVKHR